MNDVQAWAGRKLALLGTYQAATKIALSADAALSTLLTAKYGKRAGDMRYHAPETVEIADAMGMKLALDDAQRVAWTAYLNVE